MKTLLAFALLAPCCACHGGTYRADPMVDEAPSVGGEVALYPEVYGCENGSHGPSGYNGIVDLRGESNPDQLAANCVDHD